MFQVVVVVVVVAAVVVVVVLPTGNCFSNLHTKLAQKTRLLSRKI